MTDIKKRTKETYIILSVIGISIILMAFLLQSPREVFEGFFRILTNPSNLLTDYMVVGGSGAAFFNAFTIMLYCMIFLRIFKVDLSGSSIAAIVLVTGFSFFGTNIVNSLPLTIGVVIYGKIYGSELKNVLLPALYITALGPLISEIGFQGNFEFLYILKAYSLGIFIGLITTPLASSFLRFHQGYNLYNIGFTAGIIGMLFVGVFRMFDFNVQTTSILYDKEDLSIKIYITVISLSLFLYGFMKNGKSFKGIKNILEKSGRLPSDYVITDGLYPTLINMGGVGLISIIYSMAMGAVFNGPVLGGIFSVIAFGAFGKNMKNIIPIFIGVYIAHLLNIHDISATSSIIIALFGTTLAPIAGEYGIVAGIITGFLHVAMVSNIGVVHGGMNLYNNGFSGGFIAAIVVPLLNEFNRLKKEKFN